MIMKKAVITGITALGLTVGFMVFGLSSNNIFAHENRLGTSYTKAYEAVRSNAFNYAEAKEAKELSLSELKKLGIHSFNLPNKNFTAYKATNISITDKGTVISIENGDGFSLKKGDIVRVNSINISSPTNQYFSLGYVKDDVYTSTTCGSMSSPTTAWEVLEDSDAGEYRLYINADNAESENHSYDVIITIER